MPHVEHNKKGTPRNGQNSKAEIIKSQRPALARDDLSNAFAGNENNGKPGKIKDQQHSTNVKSRQSKQSRQKEPIR